MKLTEEQINEIRILLGSYSYLKDIIDYSSLSIIQTTEEELEIKCNLIRKDWNFRGFGEIFKNSKKELIRISIMIDETEKRGRFIPSLHLLINHDLVYKDIIKDGTIYCS